VPSRLVLSYVGSRLERSASTLDQHNRGLQSIKITRISLQWSGSERPGASRSGRFHTSEKPSPWGERGAQASC
jgi:hypothetical protein